MKRLIILAVSIAVIAVLIASVIFIEISEVPRTSFISERIAEEISGQDYTESILSTYGGSGLPYGSDRMWEVYYLNESSHTGFIYYFLDDILKFNNTASAMTACLLIAGLLTGGKINTTVNGTYKGFSYTCATESQKVYKNYGTAYDGGAWGYSGDVVFKVSGQSPSPPKGNMSEVAIDQINAMTAFNI